MMKQGRKTTKIHWSGHLSSQVGAATAASEFLVDLIFSKIFFRKFFAVKQTRQDSEKVQVAVHGCHFASRASADKTTISLDRIYRAIQQASSAEEAQAQQRMQDESPYGPYFHIRTYSLVAFFYFYIF